VKKVCWLVGVLFTINAFTQEARTPRWPMPRPSRTLSSAQGFRLAEYQGYVKSLSERERTEFAEDAKVSFGTLGVNSEHIVVKFKDAETEQSVVQALKFKKPLRNLSGLEVKVFQIPPGANQTELLAHLGALRELEGVEYAYPDYKIRIANTPNDPDYGRLWGLHNTGTSILGTGFPDADIDAPEAWKVSTGSRDVVVAILDTGMDYTHPDLIDNVWKNPGETGTDSAGNDKSTNGIDDDANGFIDDFRGWDFAANDNDPQDDHGHGSHVAGTIGATGNNGIGSTGVNWKVSLVALQIFDSSGSGDFSTALAALEYATQMRFPITNNSWGGSEYVEAFEDALKRNRDAGSLFIAAAGNDRADTDSTPFYPAAFQVENVISVAASDHKDQLAYFSNYGRNSVHLAAPGDNIFSTFSWGGYNYESGTSMAAPHVTGAAALIKAVWPSLTYAQVKTKILESVDEIIAPEFIGKTITGGRLNVARAVGGEPSPLPLRLALANSSPRVGPPTGGTEITVTGVGIHPQVQVTLGLKPCTNVRAPSQLELKCITPPTSILGLHNVIATNPDGTKKTLSGAFRYSPPPTLTSINSVSTLLAGGTTVTLQGTQFGTTDTQVRIGEKLCSQVQVQSSAQLTCVVPPYDPGSYRVTVINRWGQESTEPVQFTYYAHPAPAISAVNPSAGPLAGGNLVTVSGANFRSGAVVHVGGLECAQVNVLSPSQLTCRTPAQTAGTYTFKVTHTDGQTGTFSNSYTYRPAPQVTSVTPTRGLPSSGTLLTISGSQLVSGATAMVGTQTCTDPRWVSATQITCRTPVLPAGSHRISVTNPEGQSSPTSTATFEVVLPRWVRTNGVSCVTVCSQQSLVSKPSPEGAYCASGEVIPASAQGMISFPNGCSPNRQCAAQGSVNGASHQGRFCYGPRQSKNNQRTDVTMGCYCSL